MGGHDRRGALHGAVLRLLCLRGQGRRAKALQLSQVMLLLSPRRRRRRMRRTGLMGLQLSWGIRVVARSAAGFGAPKPMRRKEAAYASLNRLITRLLLLLKK